MLRRIDVILIGLLVLASCRHQSSDVASAPAVKERENLEAKQLLQGIWMDCSTDDAAFRAVGDTIYYPDAASQPNHFRIVSDSLELGSQRYPILKQGEALFWFQNQAGDTVKFYKSDSPDDSLYFAHRQPEILTVTDVIKKDSVIMVGGQRYHWYIAINPTTYHVSKTSYTSEGVAVDNVYFDNIIHISLFQGHGRSSRKTSGNVTTPPRCPRVSSSRPSLAICSIAMSTPRASTSMPPSAYPTAPAAT